MEEATQIPDEIFQTARELVEIGQYLFWKDARMVRGDSGAAVSSAVGAMLSSTFIIGLNIDHLAKSDTDWTAVLRARTREILDVLARIPSLISRTAPDDPAQIALPF